MLADYFHRNVYLFPRNDEDQTQEEKLEKRTRVRYVEKATTVEFTRCSTSSSNERRRHRTVLFPICKFRYRSAAKKKRTKRKENRRKERRWFGRVLRDRERSIFMLIGAISRISNFSPVKYHRSKVFHEGGNKSHFMEIARPPNNAQLRPATYSSLFFFSASISTGEWVSVEGEEENYGWKVFMSVDDGNVVASLLCREGDKGKNFFEMILFFRWWLFVKKIGERGRGGYEVFSFFSK